MKKLENFSWKMWHVYTLIAVAVFFIGSRDRSNGWRYLELPLPKRSSTCCE